VGSAAKPDLLRALQEHLGGNSALPKTCLSCGADLVYLNADFRVYGESTHITIPMGFCPYCDGLPAVSDAAVA
jgi:hypothetical protein